MHRAAARPALVLLLLNLAGSLAAVTLSPPRWDVDPPLQPTQAVSRMFDLRNTGSQRVAINLVETHPPLTAELSRPALEPGETAKLVVGIAPQGKSGLLTGRVVVHLAGQSAVTLEVRCPVAPAPKPLPDAAAAGQPYQPRPGDRPIRVQVFYHSGCGSCVEWMQTVIDPLGRHFGSLVTFERHDLHQPDGLALLNRLKAAYRQTQNANTWVFVGSQALSGLALDKALYRLLTDELAHPTPVPRGVTTAAAPRLGLLGALAVGLLDGLNPCAFATIVFLIALLTRLGADRRALLAAGGGYLVAVFVTYTLLGVGLLHALGRLGAARALRWGVAGLAAGCAGLQLRDVLRLRRGAPTRALSLQLPPRLQRTVHNLLRWSTRPSRGPWLLAAATAGAGVLVTLVEMACTSEVYLPVLAVLQTVGVRGRALALLLAYNVGFVLPLAVVVALALRGVGSERVAAFARRHLAAGKLGLALLLVGLAVVLVWR